ncbi:MAG: hypothetical protein KBS35_02095 [Mycoplasma sp.]|nr:hypothetical protein [Candidatus Hennigella equi]
MDIIKVLDIPKTVSSDTLPQNILKHCNEYKEEAVKKSSHFAWLSLSKYIDLTKVKFSKDGKPYILDNRKYFSLSHSFSKVAIAVSDKPIGVDIETILPSGICAALAQRVLVGRQLQAYLKAKDREVWMTKHWVKYEAYTKLVGGKLAFSSFKEQIKGKVQIKRIIGKDKRFYYLAVCKKI